MRKHLPIVLGITFLLAITMATPCLADELQFGVIYATDFKFGSPLPSADGIGLQTFVVVNIGTANFNLDDLAFTSSLVSTTTSVNPYIGVSNGVGNLVLSPGQAYGYINGDFNQPLTLAYVQSVFPNATDLIIDFRGFQASFDNPPGSGVIFQGSQSLVDYQFTTDGATAGWQTSWEVGYRGLQPGWGSGILGYTESNAVFVPVPVSPVPEPSSVVLLAIGAPLLLLSAKRDWASR